MSVLLRNFCHGLQLHHLSILPYLTRLRDFYSLARAIKSQILTRLRYLMLWYCTLKMDHISQSRSRRVAGAFGIRSSEVVIVL